LDDTSIRIERRIIRDNGILEDCIVAGSDVAFGDKKIVVLGRYLDQDLHVDELII
jgi:hypothetical protein